MADTTISSLNTVNALSANNFIPISDGTNTTKLGTNSLFGFRNRLINGDMRIWQRGTSFSNINGYTADRWFVNRATGNSGLTVNKQGAYSNTLRITRNQGDTSTTHLDLRQVIETQNCYDLAGKQVTFSFNAAKESNFTPAACIIEIYYSTVADAPSNFGSWIGLGQRQFNPTTSFQKFVETYTIPSNALTVMARIWSASYVGTAPANDAIEITQLQLEEGSTATPFEWRPIGTELALCQRYYQKIGGEGTYEISARGYVAYQNSVFWASVLPVKLRAIPNASINGNWYVSEANQPVVAAATTQNVAVFAERNISGTGDTFFYNAGNYLELNAEL